MWVRELQAARGGAFRATTLGTTRLECSCPAQVRSARLLSKAAVQTPSQACTEMVRVGDRPAYLTGLVMPSRARRGFYALRAYNLELARIRDATSSNPGTAGIRCQWWRELVGSIYQGEKTQHAAHPVHAELLVAVQQHNLTQRWLDRMIDARQDDLEDTQPQTMAAVEEYAEHTASSMMYLSLELLGVRDAHADHAASHAGKAIGIATGLNGLPFLLASGQLGLPRDLMIKHGLRTRAFRHLSEDALSEQSGKDNPDRHVGEKMTEDQLLAGYSAMVDVVFEMASAAHGHLEHARELQGTLPKEGHAGLSEHSPVRAVPGEAREGGEVRHIRAEAASRQDWPLAVAVEPSKERNTKQVLMRTERFQA